MSLGVLNVYRLLGSSFINSGEMLHPVLPKSQCWCIDGDSIFALRVRAETYYRIELPYKTEDDKRLAEQLKSVFASILRYEKTACPFRRGFDVELPESDQTVLRSSRWKNTEKARRWTLNRIWKPEDEPDYVPIYDRPMSPLTKEAGTVFQSRREVAVKEDEMSEESDYLTDATISSLANSFSRSKSVQQRWVSSSPLLIRRTRSVTPPHLKHNTGNIDARRRPFLNTIAKRPVSMYEVSPASQNDVLEKHNDTLNKSVLGLSKLSEGSRTMASREITNEAIIPESYDGTLSELVEIQRLDTPVAKHMEDEPSGESGTSMPQVESKIEPSSLESPPLTPPPLSDSEGSFSPSWTEEIITPPDTLRLRQSASRPHVQDEQSDTSSPTATVPASTEKEAESSPTSASTAAESAPEPPPEPLETPTSISTITPATTPATPSRPSTPTLSIPNASAAPITPTTPKTETDTETSPTAWPTDQVRTDLKSILTSPQGRRLGLIQKAYIILVSPPTHVFALMYEIATRIASNTLASGSAQGWDGSEEESEAEDEGREEEGEGEVEGGGKGPGRARACRQAARRQLRKDRLRRGGEYMSGRLPGMWIGYEEEEDDHDDESEAENEDGDGDESENESEINVPIEDEDEGEGEDEAGTKDVDVDVNDHDHAHDHGTPA